MDLMAIRRGLMAQMVVSGISFIKGTITPTSTGSLTVNFGKSFTDYILFIEMTDDSLTALENLAPTNYKAYTFLGKKNFKTVANLEVGNNAIYKRYNQSLNTSTLSITFNDNSFNINVADINTNIPNALYVGYSYNYTIIPFE